MLLLLISHLRRESDRLRAEQKEPDRMSGSGPARVLPFGTSEMTKVRTGTNGKAQSSSKIRKLPRSSMFSGTVYEVGAKS